MIGFDAKKNVHVRKTFRTEIPGLFPCPQSAAEIAVKADGDAFFSGFFETVEDKALAAEYNEKADRLNRETTEKADRIFAKIEEGLKCQ